MNFEEYRSIDAINFSALKSMRKSPKQFKYDLTHRKADSVGKTLGRGAHCAILEPDRLAIDFAVFKGPTRRGKEWESFKAVHGEESIIKKEEYDRLIAIRDSVRSNNAAQHYLSSGKAEHTIQWSDKQTGLKCKARLDFLSDVGGELTIVDLKGCIDVREAWFRRECARNLYHCQLSFYLQGVEAVYGKLAKCVLLAVEHSAPHDVGVFRLGESELEAGFCDTQEFLQKVKSCQLDNYWPGCYTEEVEMNMSKWDLGITDSDGVEELGLEMESESNEQ